MMPKDELPIVPLSVETVHGVAELAKACFTTPWSEAIYQRELTNPMGITYVCTANETVVGFLCCGYVLDELSINTLAVAPMYRRRGIARRLWNAMETRMRGICSVCYLEVRESNHAARTLYTALGFTQNGYRPRYYDAPEEAAVLMSKQLL